MNSDKPAHGTKIPDLYGLLGLAPQEPDEHKIKSALRQFADQVKQEKSPQAKAAAKLFAIAKHNLLEPSRKAAYDALWLKVYGGQLVAQAEAQSATNNRSTLTSKPDIANQVDSTQPDWDLTELANILPKGDANAPLDLASFLESADSANGHRSLEDLDRDFQRLVQLLGGEIASTSIVNATASAEVLTDLQPSSISILAPVVDDTKTQSTDFPLAVETPRMSVPNVRKKRKNRDLSLLFMIGGGTTALLVVLGVLVFMLNSDPSRDETRPVASIDNEPRRKVETQNSQQPKSSGLPQVGSGLPQPSDNAAVTEAGIPESPMLENPAIEPAAPANMEDSPPAAPPTNSNITASVDKPMVPSATTEPIPEPTPIPLEPEPPVSLTDKEKSEWKKLLRSARQSLGKPDFANAKETLEQAVGLAKTNQQKSQLSRLQTIVPLVEQFREAMQKAASTRSSETFKVRTQEIMLVEASEERIVVKVNGKSQRYQWDEVPIGVAYGLADLELDQSPKSAACKAAFAAVHGRINGTVKEDARKLMQAAAAAKIVPPDTHEVFDDEYSLD